MKKISTPIFYTIVISLVVFVFLLIILIPKFDKNNSAKITTNDVLNVTSFDLNCDAMLEVEKGCKFSLADGYAFVEPESFKDEIVIDIKAKNGSSSNGLYYSNGMLYADSAGNYEINFTLLNLKRTIGVTVVNETDNPIIKHNSRLLVNTAINLTDIFTTSKTGYDIKYNINNITIVDNVVNIDNAGSYVVDIILTKKFINLHYKDTITVINEPDYYFLIDGNQLDGNNEYNITYSNSEINKIKYIDYAVYDKNNINYQNQEISVNVNKAGVVEEFCSVSPQIQFRIVGVGEVYLTLTYSVDNSIQCKIKIIIQN